MTDVAATTDSESRALVVGLNMRRFVLSTAVMLYLSVPAAIAADRFGGWLLEQPRGSVLTLTFKQSASLDNKVATSELGFVCDQGDKSGIVGAVLTLRWNVRKSTKCYSCFVSEKQWAI